MRTEDFTWTYIVSSWEMCVGDIKKEEKKSYKNGEEESRAMKLSRRKCNFRRKFRLAAPEEISESRRYTTFLYPRR